MSPCLFDIFMDGCMREIKVKIRNVDTRLKINGMGWSVVASVFADDTVLFAESEEELQKTVDEFYSIYTRKKLKVNAGKSKVIVFKRREVEVVDFNTPYRRSVSAVGRCEVLLGGERIEEEKQLKYLGTVLCKHGEMEGEIRERAMKGKASALYDHLQGLLEIVMCPWW